MCVLFTLCLCFACGQLGCLQQAREFKLFALHVLELRLVNFDLIRLHLDERKELLVGILQV